MHVAESVTTAPVTTPPVRTGLEGVIAAETRKGKLSQIHFIFARKSMSRRLLSRDD